MSEPDAADPSPLVWPGGKRAAVCLTFDDARPSQVDCALPVLDAAGARATFYVSPGNLAPRAADWRAAAQAGHEMGNHTLSHPCSANFPFARAHALEDLTLERIEADILAAHERIGELTGAAATTFAYPCGQTFVGRGEGVRSYVPVVARHFVAGRAAFNERHNDPAWCDLAQLFGVEADRREFAELRRAVDQAVEDGGWLVLFAHDVGAADQRQMLRADVLKELCEYCLDPAVGVWLDTVAAVGAHVAGSRARRADRG